MALSDHVKPIAGTDSCEAAHLHRMVRIDDGIELEFGPSDAIAIPPGHDGWVVGHEPWCSTSQAWHYAESR